VLGSLEISLTRQILVKNVGLFATLYPDTTFNPLKTEFLLNNILSRVGGVWILDGVWIKWLDLLHLCTQFVTTNNAAL
jgi:hypothetical protein